MQKGLYSPKSLSYQMTLVFTTAKSKKSYSVIPEVGLAHLMCAHLFLARQRLRTLGTFLHDAGHVEYGVMVW